MAKQTRKDIKQDMMIHSFSNKVRMRRDAVGIDGRIPAEAVFLLLKRYSVERFGAQFAGPECLAIMKLSAAVGRDGNRREKIQADINDVEACLKHLLGKGKFLDDPDLRLLCTKEQVCKFITLIQNILPESSEAIIGNMTMVRFPYMQTETPEETPNLTAVALVLLVFGLGGLLVVHHWVAKRW